MNNRHNFTESISALQLAYLRNQYDTKDFWYVLDHLEDNELIKWTERMLKTKKCLFGYDFVRTSNIVFEYKKFKWSKKQKRSCAMLLIKHWDDVSIDYIY